MFNWPILDVAIGLVFIYTLLSLVCSSFKEGISRIGALRAKTMEDGLRLLLSDPAGTGKLQEFLGHPLIKAFGSTAKDGTQNAPAYIPSRAFAQVVLDLVAPPTDDAAALTTSSLAASIAKMSGNDELKKTLLSLLRSAEGDVAKFRTQIETWFDDAMDRVSGWYKRKTLWIVLVLAVVVVGATNADTLAITAALWESPALTHALEQAATDYAKNSTALQPGTEPKNTAKTLQDVQNQLRKVSSEGLPLGWHDAQPVLAMSTTEWAMKLLGLLLTSAAVCLGAPFWFDVLNKLVNLRGTGQVPAKTGATTSPDSSAQTSATPVK